MNMIFASFILISVLSAISNGQTAHLSSAIPEGASAGVTLALSLAGPVCLWSGLAHAMERCGWMDGLARLFAPVLKRIFPKAWSDRAAREALCGNVSANLLGLGNAATPLSIRASKALGKRCEGGVASAELCRLIVLNTASLQLLPMTVCSIRAGLGSEAPFDIVPAVWISSGAALCVGLGAMFLAEKLFGKGRKRK